MSKEKDIAEKTLESYSDVFADIVNGLLFEGRDVVKESELENAITTSQLKIANVLHEQERDVAKYWRSGEIRIAFCGLENQTKPDAYMPLRVISYDGASYKDQLNERFGKKQSDAAVSPVYPAVTLVLHFGDKRWSAPKSLKECFLNIPVELEPYVQDYRINVFDIAFLTPEQVSRFKSDFRIVADYLVQKRMKKGYVAPKDVIRHVDEVLKLLNALTGDDRFAEESLQLAAAKKEEISMCDIVDSFVEKGRKEGRLEGVALAIKIGAAIDSGKTETQILKLIPEATEELIQTVRNARSYSS